MDAMHRAIKPEPARKARGQCLNWLDNGTIILSMFSDHA